MKPKYAIWGGGMVLLLGLSVWLGPLPQAKKIGLVERHTRNTVRLKLAITNSLAGPINPPLKAPK